MKKLSYYLLLSLWALNMWSCGDSPKEQSTEVADSSSQTNNTESEEVSLKIEEAFNSKATLEELFKKDIAEGYAFRYKQIGEQYVLGGYTHKDTVNFGAKLFVNVDLHSCEKTSCHPIDEEGRNKQLELATYYFKDEQKKSEHYEYIAEEVEIDGKKLNLYYHYRWFPPKEAKDTIKNKKHEIVLYYNNGTNGVKVTAFPQIRKNLSGEDWKGLIDRETLKKHAETVIKPYLPYY